MYQKKLSSELCVEQISIFLLSLDGIYSVTICKNITIWNNYNIYTTNLTLLLFILNIFTCFKKKKF